jgi:NAD(P)-dependent dehydrogenase (short-subunit alcohol dehydrogenase family)
MRHVMITGGAGGLGGATTALLALRGWHVFAGDLEGALTALAEHPGVTPLPLDVTDPASVAGAVERVASEVDGLDGVVNFAGILGVGPLIEIPEADLQRVLDVNVMGTYRVNRACFPLLLARKGRIVNISSETGWMSGGPFGGPYAMSKHAIEAYSDSLRRELMLLDVAVVKIQPGPFRTAMVGGIGAAFARRLAETTHFRAPLARTGELAARENDKANDPRLLAETVHRALTARRPRAAYSVRPDPARRALDWLPTRWADALLRLVLRAGLSSGA